MRLVPLNKVFDVQYGNQFDLEKMSFAESREEGINFVSRATKNFGVVARVLKYDLTEPYIPGLITVTLGGSYLLASFIQPEKFYTAQNIKILSPKNEMTFNEKFFYCLCIQKNRYRYSSHGREANVSLDDILVPDEMPKQFIKYSLDSIMKNVSEPLKSNSIKINPSQWENFSLSDVFTKIEKCKCSNALELENGDEIYYLGAKKENNSIMKKVARDEDLVSKGNCIIFIGDGQGSIGYSTYQPNDFIGSTTLCCGYNTKLNKYNGLFLVTILDKERFKYSFGRKYGKGQLLKAKIKLPAKNGLPDFEFMENYIKSLPYSNAL